MQCVAAEYMLTFSSLSLQARFSPVTDTLTRPANSYTLHIRNSALRLSFLQPGVEFESSIV